MDMQPIFSFYLTYNQLGSKLIMGGYDLIYAKSGSTSDDIYWVDLADNQFYWTAYMGKVVMKGKNDKIS